MWTLFNARKNIGFILVGCDEAACLAYARANFPFAFDKETQRMGDEWDHQRTSRMRENPRFYRMNLITLDDDHSFYS